MKARNRGTPPLELLEEAIALLRDSTAALLIYYIATVPFVLSTLYYIAEMSGSLGAERASAGALVLALLFVAMKTGQARFASALKERLTGGLEQPWRWIRWGSCALTQLIWQPSGLIILPISALIALPFGFAYAFYQNLLLTGSGLCTWKKAGSEAWEFAKLWPMQNISVIMILLMFGFVIYLNGWILIAILPALIKMLLGIDTAMSLGGFSYGNSTFLAATLGFAYLVLDPLFKASYVLRSFYGESQRSGIDLQVQLKRLFAPATLLLLALSLLPGEPALAQDPPVEAPHSGPVVLAPEQLDNQIDQVLTRREYRWKLPRLETPEVSREKGYLSGMLDDFFDGFRSLLRDITTWMDEMKNKIRRFFDRFNSDKKPKMKETESGTDWVGSVQFLAYAVLAVVCALLAIFVFRQLRGQKFFRPSAAAYAGPMRAPDLEDERLLASELPEEEWLRLGTELASRGERRLALRAYSLAILARLSGLEFLTIARHKTNRDYMRELDRRARGQTSLQGAFATNIGLFEQVWYGDHPVEEELWKTFEMKRAEIFAIPRGEAEVVKHA